MKQSVTKIIRPVLTVAALLAFSASAFADYIPLPVKWSQPIGFDATGRILGTDRISDHTVGIVRADDFICNTPLPIVAVRWWGSYLGEGPGTAGIQPRPTTPPGGSGPFDISFHFSSANGNPTVAHPLSLPLTLMSLQTVGAQEEFVGVDQSGHYVYRYDAYLPQPFFQQGTPANPLEYFIDIDKPTHEEWGWHESPYGGLDYPAIGSGHGGPWTHDPPHDLAFELMVEQVPEPSSMLLAGLGGLFLLAWRRRY